MEGSRPPQGFILAEICMLSALSSPQTEIASLAGYALKLVVEHETRRGDAHLHDHLTPEQRLKREATYKSLGDPHIITVGT